MSNPESSKTTSDPTLAALHALFIGWFAGYYMAKYANGVPIELGLIEGLGLAIVAVNIYWLSRLLGAKQT